MTSTSTADAPRFSLAAPIRRWLVAGSAGEYLVQQVLVHSAAPR